MVTFSAPDCVLHKARTAGLGDSKTKGRNAVQGAVRSALRVSLRAAIRRVASA
jgi:hypothetical protein